MILKMSHMDKILIYAFIWMDKCNFNSLCISNVFRPLKSTCSQAATLPCLTGSMPSIPSFCLPIGWMSVMLQNRICVLTEKFNPTIRLIFSRFKMCFYVLYWFYLSRRRTHSGWFRFLSKIT